ncbi:hypothetical protein [Saccharopolyspora sp. SCSIO 74807]|uniref:hypothetical protein n=1 Tax=Saccharopolyspora sp. SCSIO 74807 TaxID=3118084 RepID=UPI0030D0DEB2
MVSKATTLPRLVALGGVLAGSVALAPVPAVAEPQAAAPTECRIHELPMPPGATKGNVSGGSPDGRTLVGTVEGTPSDLVHVVWRDGEILETPGNLPDRLEDVNSDGVAVGGIFDEYGERRPYVYRDGEVRVLPGHVTPRGINDTGQIVGFRSDAAGEVPVSWAPGSDQPVDLPGPPGVAEDVAADGTAVGTVAGETPGAPTNGFVWRPDGTSAALPRPEGIPANEHLEAHQINGPWVIGSGSSGEIRWNLDTGTAEVIPNTIFDSGAINEQGWVAAARRDSEGRAATATLFADGQQVPLPGINNWDLSASSISPDGSVIGGTALLSRGPSKPVSWTCS